MSTSLWRNADFLKLWVGQTVSLAGSLVGRFALPLVAVVTLEASPFQVGVLRVADILPAILVGLFAGVWVDRLRRRPIMIVADVGRALVLATIPLAAMLNVLTIEQLYGVAVLIGLLTIFFDVAYRSYLPSLVSRAALVEGNSKLGASNAVVEVASFGLAGALVQILTAPITILIDAVSFVVSAVSLALIRRPEPAPSLEAAGESAWTEMRAGLAFVVGHPVLRTMALARGWQQLFVHMWVSMLLLFIMRDIGLQPIVFGPLFAIGGVSAIFGALYAQRVIERLGVGRAFAVTFAVGTSSLLLLPLAGAPILLAAALVGAGQLFDAAGTIAEIAETSLIQGITPDQALGRVNACMQLVGWAAMLGGSLIGGLLGETVGVRETMWIGALGALLSIPILWWSPVRQVRMLAA